MRSLPASAVVMSLFLLLAAAVPVSAPRHTQPPDPDLPTGFQCGVLGSATNLGPSAVTFLCLEGYAPWVAMVVEAGQPQGFDSVSVTFDGTTLRIEITDDASRVVTILVNKAFADAHMDPDEGNLEIRVSEAVNYQGLKSAAPGAPEGVGGPFYVFIITSFSIRWIEISEKLPLALIAGGIVAVLVTIAVVFFIRRRRQA